MLKNKEKHFSPKKRKNAKKCESAKVRKKEYFFKKMNVLKTYQTKTGYVFKKCFDACENEYLIVLKKPSTTSFKSNENRKGVKNAKYAKFRCNGLIVIKIYDLRNQKFINQVCNHFQCYKLTYTVNNLVVPNYYETNMQEICAPGIHYFLTFEQALRYCTFVEFIYGYNADGSFNFKNFICFLIICTVCLLLIL